MEWRQKEEEQEKSVIVIRKKVQAEWLGPVIGYFKNNNCNYKECLGDIIILILYYIKDAEWDRIIFILFFILFLFWM